MKSKSTEQCRQEMQEVFKGIKKKLPEAKLIDSIIENADKQIAVKGDDIGVWFLGASIQLLAEADIVIFAKGWKEARGCVLEHNIAKAYGKYCIEI